MPFRAEPQPWENSDDPALAYAMQQLRWYSRARGRARRNHQAGELLILLSTAATVVVSALHAPAAVTASLAAVTLFLTGFRQVFSPNERWVSTSVAWLGLHQAVTRYHLLEPDERDGEARRELLDRTIEIIAEENRSWTEQRLGLRPVPSAAVVELKPGP